MGTNADAVAVAVAAGTLLMQLLLHLGIDSIRVATQKRNLKFSWLPFGPWTYVGRSPLPAAMHFFHLLLAPLCFSLGSIGGDMPV